MVDHLLHLLMRSASLNSELRIAHEEFLNHVNQDESSKKGFKKRFSLSPLF